MKLTDKTTGKVYEVEERCAVEVGGTYDSGIIGTWSEVRVVSLVGGFGKQYVAIEGLYPGDGLTLATAGKISFHLAQAINHAEAHNA